MKVVEKFQSPADQISWQYRQIIAELQELQRHASDPSCPCHWADSGEYCLAKNALAVATLANETATMDAANMEMLGKLFVEATERHVKVVGAICQTDDAPELVDWSRDWRKKLEPIYYACQKKAKMKEEEQEQVAIKKLAGCKLIIRKREGAMVKEDSDSLADGLRKSMTEELKAARVYQERAKATDDEATINLYKHVIDEEFHHYEEFKKRLAAVEGKVSKPHLIIRMRDAELQAIAKALEEAKTA